MLTRRHLAGRLGYALASFLTVGLLSAAPVAAAPGPVLEVTSAELDTALICAPNLEGATRDPVLLTPAFSTAAASYGWNYLARLPKIGVPTCSITVPDSGYGDLQRTAEYVVAAVRRMHRESGRDIVLLGHQHGALDELWALTFWPDIARKTSDLISLATPYNGTTSPAALCGSGAPCAAATRQISTGSSFVAALAAAPLPPGPAYTSIASLDDTLITPQPEASRLDGATNIVLQDICRGRQVSHFDILADAVAYELVIDAITHDGPADPSRVSPAPCGTKLMPDADPVIAAAANGFLPIFLAQNTAAAVPAEPETRPYAQRREPVLSLPKRARRLADGRIGVRLGCESVGQTSCRAKLTLRSRGAVVGHRRLVLRPGVARRVRPKVRRDGSNHLTAVLSATDALGNEATKRGRIRSFGPRP